MAPPRKVPPSSWLADFGEPFDVPFDVLRAVSSVEPLRAVSGSAEQFGPELTAEGLTVEAPVEPLRLRRAQSSR
jgi:hypothetical protein